MAKRVQRVGHETAAANAFTGLEREITVDLGKKSVRVHDGLTPGGVIVAREDLSTSPAAIGGTNDGKMTAAQATELANATAKDAVQDANIATNVTGIATNVTNIATNTGNIATNTTNIATNTSGISTNTGNIATNTSGIATNVVNIATNTANILTNTSGISTNTGNIVTNTNSIATLTNGIITAIPLTAGTALAYTAVLGINSYVTGTVYKVRIHATNTGPAFISLDGLPSTQIRFARLSGEHTLIAGELPVNSIAELLYLGGFFYLQNVAEVTGTYTAVLTTGAGSITLGNDQLDYRVKESLCTILGRITVSAISAPSGVLNINTPILKLGAANDSTSQIMHQSLGTATALGLVMRDVGISTIEIAELTTTSINLSIANFLIVNSALTFSHTYRIR